MGIEDPAEETWGRASGTPTEQTFAGAAAPWGGEATPMPFRQQHVFGRCLVVVSSARVWLVSGLNRVHGEMVLKTIRKITCTLVVVDLT